MRLSHRPMPTRRRSTRWAGGLGTDRSRGVLAGAPFGRAIDPRLDFRERPSVQAVLDRVKRDAPGVFHRGAAADGGELGERSCAVGETPSLFEIRARF